jgi:two-component system KDP operon response regulator KdpE
VTPAPPVALIVEDEKQIRRFVRTALEAHGFQVFEAESGARGLVEAATRSPDLVILDLGLPDLDGVDFLRDLRGWSDRPVIVLSARSGEAEKIRALDAGADDYLTKPFGIGELLARVRVAIRHHSRLGEEGSGSKVSFGDVEVDLGARLVSRAGKEVHLTPIEYRLLAHFLRHAGKVLTHRQILREVWGPSQSDSPEHLRVHVGHLRQKLEPDPAQPQHLLTEIGVGYRFVTTTSP